MSTPQVLMGSLRLDDFTDGLHMQRHLPPSPSAAVAAVAKRTAPPVVKTLPEASACIAAPSKPTMLAIQGASAASGRLLLARLCSAGCLAARPAGGSFETPQRQRQCGSMPQRGTCCSAAAHPPPVLAAEPPPVSTNAFIPADGRDVVLRWPRGRRLPPPPLSRLPPSTVCSTFRTVAEEEAGGLCVWRRLQLQGHPGGDCRGIGARRGGGGGQQCSQLRRSRVCSGPRHSGDHLSSTQVGAGCRPHSGAAGAAADAGGRGLGGREAGRLAGTWRQAGGAAF